MTIPTQAITASAKVIHGLHTTEEPDALDLLQARKALEAAAPAIYAEHLNNLAGALEERAMQLSGIPSRGPEAARSAGIVRALATDAAARAEAGN